MTTMAVLENQTNATFSTYMVIKTVACLHVVLEILTVSGISSVAEEEFAVF